MASNMATLFVLLLLLYKLLVMHRLCFTALHRYAYSASLSV